MISQRPVSNNHFVGLLMGCLMVACGAGTGEPPEDAAATPPAANDADSGRAPRPGVRVLVQGGGHQLTLDALRVGFDEVRILESWRAGKRAPLEALESRALRRRVIRTILQTRLLRAEFTRRGLQVDGKRYDELVRKAAMGIKPDTPVPWSTLHTALADDDIDARIVARFESPASHLRRVVLDLVERERLTEALLDALEPRALERTWRDLNTTIELDLVRIPRVPSSTEIDVIVRNEPKPIAAFYDANLRLFQRPERAFVRRLVLGVEAGDDRGTAKSRAEALRAKVASGEDMAALVVAHGPARDRRNRGRMTVTPKRQPALFGLEKGTLTAVEPMGPGFGFYRIEGYAPAMHRPLSDPRVQREAGAAVLRKSDRLPRARGVAGRVRSLLATAPSGPALMALVKENRLRRATTPAFSRAGHDRVPTIGLAPELFTAVFGLSASSPVSDVIWVRQDYVVARLVDRRDPEDGAWAAAKTDYRVRWRATTRDRVIDDWVASQLKRDRLRLDKAAIDGLTVDALRVPEDMEGR